MTSEPSANLSNSMHILIIDDERLARSEMLRMLRDLRMTGTIREASSANEGLSMVREHRPDLILLDIQMPGGSGFDFLGALGQDRPSVIFTTAYEQFAARAFDEEAVDYLLKPFGPSRLAKALSRIHPAPSDDTRLGSGDVVLLKIDGECQLLPVDSIEMIEATTEGTLVRCGKSSGIVNRTLQQLEDRLDPSLFFRCSREAILNIGAITRTSSDGKGILRALTSGGREVTFSRRQGACFRKQYRA